MNSARNCHRNKVFHKSVVKLKNMNIIRDERF